MAPKVSLIIFSFYRCGDHLSDALDEELEIQDSRPLFERLLHFHIEICITPYFLGLVAETASPAKAGCLTAPVVEVYEAEKDKKRKR